MFANRSIRCFSSKSLSITTTRSSKISSHLTFSKSLHTTAFSSTTLVPILKKGSSLGQSSFNERNSFQFSSSTLTSIPKINFISTVSNGFRGLNFLSLLMSLFDGT